MNGLERAIFWKDLYLRFFLILPVLNAFAIFWQKLEINTCEVSKILSLQILLRAKYQQFFNEKTTALGTTFGNMDYIDSSGLHWLFPSLLFTPIFFQVFGLSVLLEKDGYWRAILFLKISDKNVKFCFL